VRLPDRRDCLVAAGLITSAVGLYLLAPLPVFLLLTGLGVTVAALVKP
jgi:hypothetical protein